MTKKKAATTTTIQHLTDTLALGNHIFGWLVVGLDNFNHLGLDWLWILWFLVTFDDVSLRETPKALWYMESIQVVRNLVLFGRSTEINLRLLSTPPYTQSWIILTQRSNMSIVWMILGVVVNKTPELKWEHRRRHHKGEDINTKIPLKSQLRWPLLPPLLKSYDFFLRYTFPNR